VYKNRKSSVRKCRSETSENVGQKMLVDVGREKSENVAKRRSENVGKCWSEMSVERDN
jgi:hypothetical protein